MWIYFKDFKIKLFLLPCNSLWRGSFMPILFRGELSLIHRRSLQPLWACSIFPGGSVQYWLKTQFLDSDLNSIPNAVTCYLCDLGQIASALWPWDSLNGSTDGLTSLCCEEWMSHHEMPFLLSVTEGGFLSWGFPEGSYSKESACNAGDIGFNPWVGKIPWRRKWQPIPAFLPGKSHKQRSLGSQSRTWLSD